MYEVDYLVMYKEKGEFYSENESWLWEGTF